MSATLVLFGGSTTGAWPRFALDPSTSLDPSPPSSLHARAGMLAWVSGTYVLGMRALPGKKVAIDTPTLLGGVHTTECDWSEIGRPGAQCRPVPGASLPVLHASVLNPPPSPPRLIPPVLNLWGQGRRLLARRGRHARRPAGVAKDRGCAQPRLLRGVARGCAFGEIARALPRANRTRARECRLLWYVGQTPIAIAACLAAPLMSPHSCLTRTSIPTHSSRDLSPEPARVAL